MEVSPNRFQIAEWLMSLQDSICNGLEEADGKERFQEDIWNRPGGGGGRTRVMRRGGVIEKGGVNFSAVHGDAPAFLKIQQGIPEEKEASFYATGVSLVIHPENPFVPIIHMNVRYFEMPGITSWFGGGIDLTPHYVNQEDARFFHKQVKDSCDSCSKEYYDEFKKWADDYFFLRHRNETRGIGGIFYDQLIPKDGKQHEQYFQFMKSVGETFLPAYSELIRRNKANKFTSEHKQWQKLRRGRYVEFNLIYDRGTKFGLETDGRTESILMSLPPEAGWEYDFHPKKNSAEEKTVSFLKKGINWIG
jgi:coproporphyrinogen III oxidase